MAGWHFTNPKSGHEWNDVPLYLYPELDGSSVVGDLDDANGEEQLQFYVDYVRRADRGWWENDAVPVIWMVEPVGERAPFFDRDEVVETFLDFNTWPDDPTTGERLDWFQLPVKMHERFPEFATALRWTPSPLQSHCPLRSIMASRAGIRPRRA